MGGGLAAQRCCETLRALGHDGPITIAGAERSEPYDRPPLSKEGLAGALVRPPLPAPRVVRGARRRAAARRARGAPASWRADGRARGRRAPALRRPADRDRSPAADAAGAGGLRQRPGAADAGGRAAAARGVERRRPRHGDRRRADRPRGRLQRAPPRRAGDRRRGRAAAARRPARPRGRAPVGGVAPRGRRRPAARHRGRECARRAGGRGRRP